MTFTRFFSFLVIFSFIPFELTFSQEDNSSPFGLDFEREATLIGGGTAAGITALTILFNLDPLTKEQINALNPEDVNSFDRGAIGPFREDHLGDALLYGSYLLPLAFLASTTTREDFLELALMFGEAILLDAGINGIVKATVKRVRPFVYDDTTPVEEKTNINARVSFYSGHTSITACATFFTAGVFSEYFKDNTAKVLIWSAAAIYPAIAGFTRVDAHWHFPTDVIVGYIIGAAIGYLIPEIHKSDKENNVSIQPSGNLHNPVLSIQIKF